MGGEEGDILGVRWDRARPLLDDPRRTVKSGATAFACELFHQRTRTAGVGLELKRRGLAIAESGRRGGLLRLLRAAASTSGNHRCAGRPLRAQFIGAKGARCRCYEGVEHELAAIKPCRLLIVISAGKIEMGLFEQFVGRVHKILVRRAQREEGERQSQIIAHGPAHSQWARLGGGGQAPRTCPIVTDCFGLLADSGYASQYCRLPSYSFVTFLTYWVTCRRSDRPLAGRVAPAF